VYSQGDIIITGDGTTGMILSGSVVGSTIQLETNLMLHLKYNNALMADPPPGIDFIEIGEWQEPFSQ